MGNKDNVHDYIIDAKMFILTSKYEGMPNALLEAMSLGIPSICSNYNLKNSIYEFIDNEKNGFVYEQGNKHQLLEIMEKISKNDKIVEIISNNAKDICEKNSEQKIFEMWENYIKNL